MKRVICWILGHNLNLVVSTNDLHTVMACSRCGVKQNHSRGFLIGDSRDVAITNCRVLNQVILTNDYYIGHVDQDLDYSALWRVVMSAEKRWEPAGIEPYVTMYEAMAKQYEGDAMYGEWTPEGILYGDGRFVPHQEDDENE